jgi:O-methyltransferase involved in polyketide biosynthesis
MVRSIDYDAAKHGRGAGGSVTVLRTGIIDFWVRRFLTAHPAGTLVELGTGLNTRFERSTTARFTGSISTWPTRSTCAGRSSLTPNFPAP